MERIYKVGEEIEKLNALKRPKTPQESKRYFDLYAEHKKLRKKWREDHSKEYNKLATKATTLKIGDFVDYHVVSPFGGVDVLTGVVVKYRGRVQIKLDIKVNGKRYASVHTGWKKIKT